MDFRRKIAEIVSSASGVSPDAAFEFLETPPERGMGDYALPCFNLAKELRMPPPRIAAELAGKIETGGIVGRAEAVGGYLNFFLDRPAFMRTVVGDSGRRRGLRRLK